MAKKRMARRAFLERAGWTGLAAAGVCLMGAGDAPEKRGRRQTKPTKSGIVKMLRSEKTVYQDRKTGNEVWRMTQGNGENLGCYMTVEAITRDERYAVFSSNRTGSFQLYRVELESGELAQLSDVPQYNGHSLGMAPNGREAYYVAGSRIYATDVAAGDTRLVVDFEGKIPGPLAAFPFAMSRDGDQCLAQYYSEPDSAHLVMALVKTGEFHAVLRWIGRLCLTKI